MFVSMETRNNCVKLLSFMWRYSQLPVNDETVISTVGKFAFAFGERDLAESLYSQLPVLRNCVS